MSDDDRRHFNNLLLLCGEHHPIIDNKENESQYPVKLLKQWKKNHEETRTYVLSNNVSLLSKAITVIANIDTENSEEEVDKEAFNIQNKIEHNDIKRAKPLIDEYKVYYKKVNALYAELESQGSFKKEKLLRNIKRIYLAEKGKYLAGHKDELSAVRSHADDIFEGVETRLHDEAKGATISEDLSFGITAIMVDAFIKCRILEKPPE